MRLNKFIAGCGYCSRREADRLIAARRVLVNGQVARLGTQVSVKDKVEVDHQLISNKQKKVYLAFFKPVGVITTTDSKSDNNVMDYVNIPTRIFPVGRLDVASSGLLILTNDGELAQKLMRHENNVEKEYEVEVDKKVTLEFLSQMASGVQISYSYKTLPAKVKKLGHNKFSIILVEGKNRQIRKMCEHLGYSVKKLVRTRIGQVKLLGLKPGEWRELKDFKPQP
ncbi:MAG: 23S rRNA pseudouridine synthase F [Candidatus Buchananbacteria bacterium CG10_big_fil_rev_8_21_14_0_10_42_9]|uniref:Pseudouridine synthase n=1 Tax=Candidatus Buchananbacteria bacterium CG10_big_fil_rev_8_21_14_0_10_42_9 TaxID=1974526 RepID=A0A2H0W251_9BACT|nr:MAG: 23S rRNA pseudouridine synthase F [Candidatus Buchananbacteria bacterium CG10_big_fil_rev_8_21_14_0_10_42_9]